MFPALHGDMQDLISNIPNKTALINPNSIIFDPGDIDYLVKTFSIDQLRQEIKTAWKRLDTEIEWRWQFYYRDFIRACKLAIQIIRSLEAPTKTASNKFVDIDSLKQSVDIVDIAEKYTHLTKSGRNYHGLCPFHTEQKPSFVVYPDNQTFHCFGACNIGGDVIALVIKAENTDFKGAVAILEAK